MKSQAILTPKYLLLGGMLYMSLFLASMTMGYKFVAFGQQLYCGSVFIFPWLFPLGDTIAEFYGPELAKNLVWFTLLCEGIFVFSTNIVIHMPSPSTWHHQSAYNYIIGSYPHILFANAAALFVSTRLNVVALLKWKQLLNGRYYFLRSIGATAIGEIAYTLISNTIAFWGVATYKEVINIMVSDYIFKLIYSIVIAYPLSILVAQLKYNWGISHQSYFGNLSLFGFKLPRNVVSFQAKKIAKTTNYSSSSTIPTSK
jgi:hypothetical protein